MAGKAWLFEAGLGGAMRGKARRGRRGLARYGESRQGGEWHGLAGTARLGRVNRATARRGMARQAKRKGSGQMVYRWKVEKYQVDAQSAGEELQRIEQKYGGLRPYEIVTESRPETAPLHSCFLWDEREAAERYRLEQARELLRNIVVVNLVQPDTPAASEPVRAFVSLKGPPGTAACLPFNLGDPFRPAGYRPDAAGSAAGALPFCRQIPGAQTIGGAFPGNRPPAGAIPGRRPLTVFPSDATAKKQGGSPAVRQGSHLVPFFHLRRVAFAARRAKTKIMRDDAAPDDAGARRSRQEQGQPGVPANCRPGRPGTDDGGCAAHRPAGRPGRAAARPQAQGQASPKQRPVPQRPLLRRRSGEGPAQWQAQCCCRR